MILDYQFSFKNIKLYFNFCYLLNRIIPESVRWLQTNGRHEEAFSILKKISDSNDMKLPDKILEEHKELAFRDNEDNVSLYSL